MIKLNSINKNYFSANKNTISAVKNVSATFPSSGVVAITGKSGCGKTTLLNLLGSLDKADSGEIIYELPQGTFNFSQMTSAELDAFRNLYIGFVFQDYYLIENWTVEDNIRIVLEQQCPDETENKKTSELIRETLEYVGLSGYEKRFANELSGGEKQRVAFARALIKQPCVILADEPTGNLDSESGEVILSLLKKYSKNCLIIMVTHDIDAAEKYADRLIRIKDGQVVSDSDNDNETSANTVKKTDEVHTGIAKRICSLTSGMVVKLAKNQLLIKKLKLVFMSLVMTVLLTGIMVALSLLTVNYGKAIKKALAAQEISLLHPYKTYSFTDRNGYPDKAVVQNSQEVIETFEQSFGKNSVKRVIDNVVVSDIQNNGNDVVNLVVGGTVPEKILLEGRMPCNNHEIVLNDVTLMQLGIKEFSKGLQVDLLGYRFDVCGVMKYNAEKADSRNWYENEGKLLLMHGNRALVSEDFPTLFSDSERIFLSLADLGDNRIIASSLSEKITIMPLSAGCGELTWGRLPKTSNEIVISEGYALRNSLDEDYHEGNFWNIYGEECGEAFKGYMNLSDYLENVVVCGCCSVSDNSPEEILYVDESVFKELRLQYIDGFFADEIEVCIPASISNRFMNSIIDKKIGLLNEEYAKVIDIKNDFDLYRTWFKLLFFLSSALLMVVMTLFISFNVKDNRKNIGILKALGCSGRDIFRVWNFESFLLCGFTGVISCAAGCLILGSVNRKLMNTVGLESNLIFINPVLFAAIIAAFVLLCLLMVAVPVWEMGDKKPIDLIKSRM